MLILFERKAIAQQQITVRQSAVRMDNLRIRLECLLSILYHEFILFAWRQLLGSCN